MNKKSFNLYLCVLISLIISIFISCDLFLQSPTELITTPQIKGNVSLPEGSNLNYSDIWVKETISNKITQVKDDGTFSISGLEEDKKYTLYFSDSAPSTVSKSAKAISSSHFGAQVTDVVATLNDTESLETVPLKKTGYINGKVTLKDDNDNNLDNVGIDVYVPGTSFIAKTDEEGNYSISNVPQGKYILRMEKNSYEGIYSEELILLSETEEDPILNVSEYILKKETGSISGNAKINGNEDNAGIGINIEGVDSTNTYTGFTSSNGNFIINNIIPGKYKASITYANCNTFITEELIVEYDNTTNIEEEIVLYKKVGSIIGSITNYDNSPAKNVQVVATDTNGVVYVTNTISDGSFSLNNLIPDTYSLTFSKTGYFDSVKNNIIVSISKINDIGTLSLSLSSCGISGVVKLEEETSYEGVQVIATSTVNSSNQYSTHSYCDGSYSFINLPKDTYNVTFSKDGFIKDTSSIVSTNYGTVSKINDIILVSTLSSVSGTITLEGTTSYENVNILLKDVNNDIQYNTTTDTTGSYIINKVNPNTYTILVSKEGYSSKESTSFLVTASTNKIINNIELLAATKSIIGKVDLSSSNDESGVLITATNVDDNTLVYSASSNISGGYSLSEMQDGEYQVTISKSGYQTQTLNSISVSHNNIRNLDTTILYPSTGILKGIVNSDINNNAGTIIKIENSNNSYQTSTSTDGSYSIRNIVPGYYDVTITNPKYLTYELNNIEIIFDNTTTLDTIQLTKNVGSIEGLVVDSNNSPAKNVQVVATDTNGVIYVTNTISDGSFSLNNLSPSTYLLNFNKDGYISKTLDNILVEYGKINNISDVILIKNSNIISGKVFLTGETTYEDVQVIATSTSNNNLKFQTFSLDDGSYILSNIPEGQFTISYYKDGFNSNTSTLVNTTLGQIINLDNLTLTSTSSTVSGNVILDSAYSHEGINILLKADDASIQYSTTTDTAGDYIFNKVEAGVYTLFASKDGYNLKENTQITIEPATDISLDSIKLDVAIRSVIGNVNLELSEDNAGALVTATNLSDTSLIYSAITNTDGNFTLAGMQPGEYRISITYSGYRTTTLPTIDIVNDTLNDIGTAELVIARGTIEGIATLEGETSYEGTTVELVGTEYSTITDEDGIYSFSVPSKNYPGGVRYSREDYKTESEIETISVLTDSTYSVPSVELICEKSTIKGLVNVSATDDNSNVTVSIKNNAYTLITDINGEYEFNHIPLGQYTLVFERENTPTVEKQITLTPGFELIVDEIIMIPNSASIIGTISLDSETDYSNVKVTATTTSTDNVYTTYSNASGYFKVSNLISTGTHTLTFTKEGWDSEELIVSNLTPLEEKDITLDNPITLYDTTKPIINSLVINSGANTAADKTVTLHIDATEKGSGFDKMQICYDNDFEGYVEKEDYYSQVEKDLESGNGLKTVYLRIFDKAGNISDVISTSVTLTDQKKEVSGVLGDDELHWTIENSPYLVVGNVLVEEGDTLIIDPGVDVQFPGPYSITVDGFLNAVGEEENLINFYGIDEGIDNWEGIKSSLSSYEESGTFFNPTFVSGNHIKYATLDNCKLGLNGSIFAEKVSININGNLDTTYCDNLDTDEFSDLAIYNFVGVYKNGSIRGNIYNEYETGINRIINCDITSNTLQSYYSKGFYLIGNEIKAVSNLESNSQRSKIGAYQIYYWYNDFYAYNNSIEGFNYCDIQGKNNTIKDISSVVFNNPNLIISANNTYVDCNFKIIDYSFTENNNSTSYYESYWLESLNNFIDCGIIETTINRTSIKEFYLIYNYWGSDKTNDLNRVGDDADLDFFVDYYDDFNLSKINYSNWSQEPFKYSGYLGDNYIGFEIVEEFIPTENPVFEFNDGVLTPINPTIEFKIKNDGISNNKISEYIVVDDISFLNDIASSSSEWESYPTSGILSYTFEDNSYDSNSSGTLFIQVKDTEGNISGIQSINKSSILAYGALRNDTTLVFYDKGNDNDGWRYLEVAPYGWYNGGDDPRLQWGAYDYEVRPSASATEIGFGKINTENIVAFHDNLVNVYPEKGDYYTNASNYNERNDGTVAAKECSEYSIEINGVTYDDWFLPSIDESNLMYKILLARGLGGFSPSPYWSSSEYDDNLADQAFSSGLSISEKQYHGHFRPIRAF